MKFLLDLFLFDDKLFLWQFVQLKLNFRIICLMTFMYFFHFI